MNKEIKHFKVTDPIESILHALEEDAGVIIDNVMTDDQLRSIQKELKPYLKQAQNGEQLQVTSPGTQRRNFTHIDDTIAALSLIGELGVGDGYGIASDESFSILELAKMITEDYRVIPPKPGNRLSSSVETQKTKELGWKVKNNLRDYIRKNLMK